MIIQLNPTIPMTTPKGKGYALFLIDYSQEHDCLWAVADDLTGEIWFWNNSKVRMQTNISMGRIQKSDE
jgi:hypothetical protein